MSDARPTRQKSDLADMLELLLDKGVVINADIAVTVGETELLGIKLRAAVASFETAAKYGMEFPEGTDMDRVERAAGVEPLEDRPGEQVELNELEIEAAQSDEEVDAEGDSETENGTESEDDEDEEAETKAKAAAETGETDSDDD